MEPKFNKSTKQRPEGDRPLDASLISADLTSLINQIKNEIAWKNSDRNAITIFKTSGLRIVLVAMHKNAEMTKHTADGIISVQLIEGCLNFSTEFESLEIIKGQLIALHENIPHSIYAIEESVFLLTLNIYTPNNFN